MIGPSQEDYLRRVLFGPHSLPSRYASAVSAFTDQALLRAQEKLWQMLRTLEMGEPESAALGKWRSHRGSLLVLGLWLCAESTVRGKPSPEMFAWLVDHQYGWKTWPGCRQSWLLPDWTDGDLEMLLDLEQEPDLTASAAKKDPASPFYEPEHDDQRGRTPSPKDSFVS
jgi:hypothetical protein